MFQLPVDERIVIMMMRNNYSTTEGMAIFPSYPKNNPLDLRQLHHTMVHSDCIATINGQTLTFELTTITSKIDRSNILCWKTSIGRTIIYSIKL